MDKIKDYIKTLLKLAIQNNPEVLKVVRNAKATNLVVQNYNQNQPRVPKGNPKGGQFAKNTVDLTNYFTSTPTMKEVKEFLNKMVEEGKEFATSSPDWLIDIPQSSKKRKHIAYSSQYKFMSNTEKRRHNKYVLALEDLLKNAEYLNEKSNTKPLENPNTEKYHYFGSNVRIGKKVYKIIFDTEEFKGDSTIKPQTVHLYDVQEVKNSSSGANDLMSVKNPKEESNTIITDNREDFNPMINNNVQNWNEADHPRDEAGKFTDKKSGLSQKIKENENRTKESEKRINREYMQIRVKEYQKSVKDDPKSEGVFTNDDGTWLLTEIWGKGKDKDGWDLVKGGKVIKHFNDRYEAYDAWDNGYFSDIDSMDKQTAQNNKEQDMALLDELKKLITKVENEKVTCKRSAKRRCV